MSLGNVLGDTLRKHIRVASNLQRIVQGLAEILRDQDNECDSCWDVLIACGLDRAAIEAGLTPESFIEEEESDVV